MRRNKALSLNGARKFTGKRDWSGVTHMRSGSAVIAAMIDNAPSVGSYDDRVKALLVSIKKLNKQNERDKQKINRLADGYSAVEKADLRRKILHRESHLNKKLFALEHLQIERQSADKREIAKFESLQAQWRNEYIKLENGKTAPKKKYPEKVQDEIKKVFG